MNPLETLLAQLMQQAGPRGATFAGRVIPQGQTPDLRTLMTQTPTESPDAEGIGGAALAAGPLATKMLMPPKPFMKLGKQGGKGFAVEQFPVTLKVRVKLPNGEVFEDAVKGLNRGHAAARARSNWEGLPIEFLDATK